MFNQLIIKMFSFIIFIVSIFTMKLCVSAAAIPADLGTFGSHNDFQNSISSYSIPATTNNHDDRQIIDHQQNQPYQMAFINYSYVTLDGVLHTFSEEKGKYGEGQIFNVRGVLVHVTSRYDTNDHTACSPLIKGTMGREFPPKGTWVALVKRGECNFEEKVKHVYEKNALAVIVYNDRDVGQLDKMKIVDKERNITAVFTYKWLGEQMAKLVDEGNDLHASVSQGRPSKVPPNINRTSVLFVSISFIVLMIISLVWLIFYYVQRFRYLQTKDRKSRQLCSVAKRIIAKIPTKSIKSDDKQIENDCCAICIEPYKVTDLIRMLPCRHDFHKCCIDPWLLEHRTCPMCKMDILKHYGFVFTGSQESILQLDLDMEEGEPIPNTTNGGNDENNHRARSVSQTFIIQLDHDDHLRRSSVESVTSIQRSGQPETFIVNNNDPIETNAIKGNGGISGASCAVGTGTGICAGCVAISKNRSVDNELCDKFDKKKESISLPCTLRKCKGSDSSTCRGSNNCYVWALDFQQLSKKMHKLDKPGVTNAAITIVSGGGTVGCPKSKTICGGGGAGDSGIKNPESDNEFLLAADHQIRKINNNNDDYDDGGSCRRSSFGGSNSSCCGGGGDHNGAAEDSFNNSSVHQKLVRNFQLHEDDDEDDYDDDDDDEKRSITIKKKSSIVEENANFHFK